MYSLSFRWVLSWLPETLIWILQTLFRKKILLAWYQCIRWTKHVHFFKKLSMYISLSYTIKSYISSLLSIGIQMSLCLLYLHLFAASCLFICRWTPTFGVIKNSIGQRKTWRCGQLWDKGIAFPDFLVSDIHSSCHLTVMWHALVFWFANYFGIHMTLRRMIQTVHLMDSVVGRQLHNIWTILSICLWAQNRMLQVEMAIV